MCAIFGAVSNEYNPDVIKLIVDRLTMINHRGYEAAGVVYSNGRHVWHHKDFGIVPQVFTEEVIDDMRRRRANLFISQTLYSTSIGRSTRNVPPQFFDTLPNGRYGLVHNGNLPNLDKKKKDLKAEAGDAIYFNEDDLEIMSDTEFMLKHLLWLIGQNNWDTFEGIRQFIEITQGSYSAALLYKDGIYLFRDPWGNRPLFYAHTDKGIFFSSEDCALEYIGNESICEVLPGQIVSISENGRVKDIKRVKCLDNYGHCVFENVYFARPDSHIFSKEFPISEFRRRLGRELAIHSPVPNADMITDIPDSGRCAAQGFGLKAETPFVSAYVKDKKVGRTFINPSAEIRRELAKIKCRLDRYLVKDKVVVIIDDSIVRGNTIEGKVKEMKKAGAKEVHVRISFPLIKYQCFHGMDFPTREELVGANMNVEAIKQKVGADSLYFQSLDSLNRVIKECGLNVRDFCEACCTGEYPIPVEIRSGP
jgi:amidophosphoribosyltransferase